REGPQGLGGSSQGVIDAAFPVITAGKVKGQLGKLRDMVPGVFLFRTLLKQMPDQTMKAAAARGTDFGIEALTDFIMAEGEAAQPVGMHKTCACPFQQMPLNHF